MSKRKSKNKKIKRYLPPKTSLEKGFDFAEQRRVMGIADIDFNKALTESKIFACAYGYQKVVDFPNPMPFLTLVGENQEAFRRAFMHFAQWGCEEDGDAVDMQLLLKRNGTYEMWIGPEVERLMYRTVPQASLSQPMAFNLFWVKPFDSTQPFLRYDLKQYCKSAISPISISAAVADPKNTNINQIKAIDGLPKIIKFGLQIIDEEECGDDPRFRLRKRQPKHPHKEPGSELDPEEYCWRRRKTFDVAFPVSRERIRRSGLVNRVRTLTGFADFSETQIVQAAINLMLSDELVSGDRHYCQIGDELSEKLWEHIYSRYETVSDKLNLAGYDPVIVAHQIELDVRYVLRQRGYPTAGKKLEKLQAFFRRKGYIDD